MRTPTNIEITVVDLQKLYDDVMLNVAVRDPARFARLQDVHCGSSEPLGFIDTPEGVFVLNSDGFGPHVPLHDKEGEGYPLQFYPTYKVIDNENSVTSCMPEAVGGVGPKGIRQMTVTQKMNLADFIRVFGPRQEAYYEFWRQRLEQAMKFVAEKKEVTA